MANRRFVVGTLLVVIGVGVGGVVSGEPARLEAGNIVFVSARLESSPRRSDGLTVVGKVSVENVGVAAQHADPYVLEPCSALQVIRYDSKQVLLKTKDERGMKHTFQGNWAGRMHSTQQECMDYMSAHPMARVTENRKLRYELQNP